MRDESEQPPFPPHARLNVPIGDHCFVKICDDMLTVDHEVCELQTVQRGLRAGSVREQGRGPDELKLTTSDPKYRAEEQRRRERSYMILSRKLASGF